MTGETTGETWRRCGNSLPSGGAPPPRPPRFVLTSVLWGEAFYRMFYWDALGGSAPAAWASYGEEGVIFGKTEGANYPHGGRPRGGGDRQVPPWSVSLVSVLLTNTLFIFRSISRTTIRYENAFGWKPLPRHPRGHALV